MHTFILSLPEHSLISLVQLELIVNAPAKKDAASFLYLIGLQHHHLTGYFVGSQARLCFHNKCLCS